MVKMSARYTGQLRCELTHEPSSTRIQTDAPKDNQGKGESFSPTDLVGAALASCVLTTMGIVAKRDGVSIDGAHAEVTKEMSTDAPRRIVRLPVKVTLPDSVPADYRSKLEHAAIHCPVHKSLSAEIQAPIEFSYSPIR